MNKIKISSLLFIAFLMISNNTSLFAQNSLREKMLSDIFREKIREQRVPQKGTPTTGSGSGFGKTANAEHKVSGDHSAANTEAEVFIAIDPVDSSRMALSYIDFDSVGHMTCPLYYSSDMGSSWSKSTFSTADIVNTDFPSGFIAGGGDPTLAYDKTGKLYFAWINLVYNSTFDTAHFGMYWASSTNNGATFQYSAGDDHFIRKGLITGQGGSQSVITGFIDREWLSVDCSNGPYAGNLYCSGVYFPDNQHSNDGGMSLSTKKADSAGFHNNMAIVSNLQSQFSNTEVDQLGYVHLSFADIVNNRIYHGVSTDGGKNFSTTMVAQSELLYGPPSVQVHGRENAAPNLAIDSRNYLHIVWTDMKSSGYDSYYSRSTDGGSTWSTPLSLNDFYPAKCAFMPTISAHGDRVSISMYVVNLADARISSEYFYITSLNNGQSFRSPVKLSAGVTHFADYQSNEFFGDYNRAVRSDCKVFSFWGDGRDNEGPKVYLSVFNECDPTGIRELTMVNSGVKLMDVYPNPAKDEIHLNLTSTSAQKLVLRLFDLNGKEVYHSSVELNEKENTLSIATKQLSSGTYLLKAENPEGLLFVRKVVRE